MLWLQKNKPELFDDSVMNKAVLEAGSRVGALARNLFGEYTEIPFTPDNFGAMLGRTKKLIEAGTPVIAEAAFSRGGMFCMVDLLKNLGDNNFEIYEVKSSTKCNEIYLHDVSFQRYLLEEAGYNVTRVCVVHINNQYVRHGDLDLSELFHIEDVTERIEALREGVVRNVAKFKEVLKESNEPICDIGEHCFLPYPCGFWEHCSCHLPKPSVFDVANMRVPTKCAKYRDGLVTFEDLADDELLTANQKLQVEMELSGGAHIDRESIRDFLKTLSYPMYFLDFETFSSAIPPYDGIRPYQQIPFQYSLHIANAPDGELEHTEFLGVPEEDPRRALAEQLCTDIPIGACTVAYNMRFEKGVIAALAKQFPDLASHLMDIHDNMKDIMIPFAKRMFYLRAMQGSYSIKYVLPALFPNEDSLNYGNLDGVHNGAEAAASFANMANMDADERAALRKNLLIYCGLDTFAMVKVLERLREVAG